MRKVGSDSDAPRARALARMYMEGKGDAPVMSTAARMDCSSRWIVCASGGVRMYTRVDGSVGRWIRCAGISGAAMAE
jgi:hypothetical protein